jgi:hypothetical protein
LNSNTLLRSLKYVINIILQIRYMGCYTRIIRDWRILSKTAVIARELEGRSPGLQG